VGVDEVSHRISKERARMLIEKELELQQMQHEGKTLPKSRRQKKYELTRRKQDGILWRIKDRGGFWGDKKELR